MKAISVKLSDELAARLEREARQRGCIKSDVVRDCSRPCGRIYGTETVDCTS
jgi:hypothetical protein